MVLAALILAALLGDGVLVLAQAAGGDPNSTVVLTIINYGALGALVILLLTRRLRTAGEVIDADARTVEERRRAEDAEARERAMAETLRTEVVPAMVRFTDIASRLLDRDH